MSESTDKLKDTVVLERERHLKWRLLDAMERLLMWLSGLLIGTFTVTVLLDVVTRSIGHPWLWLQEVTLGAFVWGIFLGGAVAVRRNEHFVLASIAKSLRGKKRVAIETFNHLVVLGVSLSLVYFGYINFLHDFGSVMQPSGTPIAVITGAIPVAGILITLFTGERLINGWRNGFEERDEDEQLRKSYEQEMGVGE